MNKWIYTCMAGFIAASMQAQTPAQINADFEARRADLSAAGIAQKAFKKQLAGEAVEPMRFLYAYMAWPDMADYSFEYYRDCVNAALRAKREMPWGAKVPRREWLHFVVPPRINNENLDTFRTAKYEELKQRVQHLTMREAVLEVNHWCHEYVTYRPSDARTSSPLASMRTATGRCGEESTFTVAALRAVGIPARQVYTPRWAHTDDNHAWVEAWVDGKWMFLGACEPEPVLNLGWFNAPASRGMLMHTKVFGRYDGPEDVMSRTPCYTEINVTANYAPVAKGRVRVVDEKGKAVSGASVDFKLYNYADLFTMMHTRSDANGEASITAGLGDLVAWAAKDGRYGFAPLHVGRDSVVTVELSHEDGDAFSVDLNLTPPVEHNNLPEVSDEAARSNNVRKAYEDSIRAAYVATFPDSAATARFCKEHHLDFAVVRPYIEMSRGNYAAMQRFLTRETEAERQLAFSLLRTMSEKDLRDFNYDVVDDHFRTCLSQGVNPADDLGVRIANEGLTPWRSFFAKAFSKQQRIFRADPEKLAQWIRDNISVNNAWNPQGYCLSPEKAYTTRKADTRSCGLLFVAAARALGIPSRIDPVTAKVQYRLAPADGLAKDGPWTDVSFEKAAQKQGGGTGRLKLTYEPRPRLENPAYYRHFTLSRLADGRPALQEYGEEDTWKRNFSNGIATDAGTYLLTSGTRLASGSVLAHLATISVKAEETATAPIVMREDTTLLQVIGSFNAENLYTDAATGREQSLLAHTGRGYYVAVLLRANHEPSTHVLHDLEALKEDLEAWGRPIMLIFASQADYDGFLARRSEFPNLPKTAAFGIDSKGQVQADFFSGTLTKSRELPVVALTDTFNRVVFMTQGYTIGIGEQIKAALKKL